LALLSVLAAGLNAEILINFDVPNVGAAGSINYAGGSSALVGSGITVSQIVGVNTPASTGPLACVGCVLNFSTLANTSASATSWSFVGGPSTSFRVTGAIPTLALGAGSTLLSGYFSDSSVNVAGAGTFRGVFSSVIDTKNSAVVDFFMGSGFSATVGNTFAGNYIQQFTATTGAGNSFSSTTILDGHISNVVPEPSSVILFGTMSGALGLALVRRLRKRAA
jgi:hypothetical protein